MKNAGDVCGLAGFINQSGGRAGEKNHVTTRNHPAEGDRFLAQFRYRYRLSRSHDPDFDLHITSPSLNFKMLCLRTRRNID